MDLLEIWPNLTILKNIICINETHKIEIQTNHPIPVKWSDLSTCGFCCFSWSQSENKKKEKKKKLDKY